MLCLHRLTTKVEVFYFEILVLRTVIQKTQV